MPPGKYGWFTGEPARDVLLKGRYVLLIDEISYSTPMFAVGRQEEEGIALITRFTFNKQHALDLIEATNSKES